jgi:hypothetical protein
MVVCMVAGFIGGMFANHPDPRQLLRPPEIVRARRFQVTDERGRLAAELTPHGLDLFGQDGRVRATLRLIYNDNGVLGFSDGKWEGRVVFGFIGTDTPSVRDDNWGLLINSPDMRHHVVSLGTDIQGHEGYFSIWKGNSSQTIPNPK